MDLLTDTARARMAHDAARLADAFLTAHVGTWELDLSTEAVQGNAAFAQLLGLPPDAAEWPLALVRARIHPEDHTALTREAAAARQSGELFTVSLRVVRPDDAPQWLYLRGAFVYDRATGAPVGIAGGVRDFTEEHAREARLRQSEERLTLALEGSQEAVFDVDLEARAGFVSAAFWHMLGEPPREEAITLDVWLGRIHPDDLPLARGRVADHLDGRVDRFEVEYRMRHADGRFRWMRDRGAIVGRTPDGRPHRLVGTHADVHERNEAQLRLQQSEALFRALTVASPVGIYMTDEVGAVTYANPRLLAIFDCSLEEIRGQAWRARVHPEDRLNVLPMRDELARLGLEYAVEYRILAQDGTERHVQSRSVPLGAEGGPGMRRVGTITDLTARRAAEATVTARERELEEAQRIAHLGSFLVDLETQRMAWSAEHYRLYGQDPALFTPSIPSVRALLHPEDRGPLDELIAAAVRRRDAELGTTVRVPQPDGSVRHLRIRAELVYRDDGMPLALRGTALDVTEIMHAASVAADAARAVDQAQRELAAVVDALPVGIVITDRAGVIRHRNPAVAAMRPVDAMCGHAADRAAGCSVRRADGGELLPREEYPLQRTLRTGAVSGPEKVLHECEIGGRMIHLVSAAPLHDAEGALSGAVLAAMDVSQHEKMATQLRQAQKMEALGQLAGGVAHDFNNLLTAIIAGADLIADQLPSEHAVQSELVEVKGVALRAAALTRRLLAFSRQQALLPQPIDVSGVLAEAEKLLRRVLPESVHFSTAYAPDRLVVLGDSGQMEQIVLNLAVNARDAMPDGGSLILETARVQRTAAAGGIPAGDYAQITIRDTGVGMDERTRDRVFEPFFTTKLPGQGTGLGLATVYGIVSQSGGYIEVDSVVGAGTQFTIWLPLIANGGLVAAGATAIAAAEGRGETLLVVEDERAVRAVAVRALTRYGYRVLEAQHGRDALAVWDREGGHIDLVLTDLRMPEMDGPTLVRQLRAIAPTLPVILMSGYASGGEAMREYVAAGERSLAKPFMTADLLREVRVALDTAAALRT